MFRYGYVTKKKWTNDAQRRSFENLLSEIKKEDKNKSFNNNTQLQLMSKDVRHPQIMGPINQEITGQLNDRFIDTHLNANSLLAPVKTGNWPLSLTLNQNSGERAFVNEPVITHTTRNNQAYPRPSNSREHHIVDHEVNSAMIDSFTLFRSNLISQFPDTTISEWISGFEKWNRKVDEANLRESFQESQWL